MTLAHDFQNEANTLALLGHALRATTGGMGLLAILPEGWVNLAYYPFKYDDTAHDYYGPVIEVTPDFISIEIFGRRATFPMDSVTVHS